MRRTGETVCFQPDCEQERCRPLRLPPRTPSGRARRSCGSGTGEWPGSYTDTQTDRQGGSEPWGGGTWARPWAENRMAVGSLVDPRPARREASPQTTQEAVRKAAVPRQRPRRGQPRKTADWRPPGHPVRRGLWRGGGGGRLLFAGGQPPLPLPQPSPAEPGAQTATPPGSRQAPASGTGSRVRSPHSRPPGLSAPSLQLPGSL